MLTTQKISKPLSRAESATIMNTILDRYRWRSEATARRASAEWALSSPRPLSLLSIFSLPSILQPERGEVLGHPAFPLRTTQSLANLHHGAYLPQQASTPPQPEFVSPGQFRVHGGFFSRPQPCGVQLPTARTRDEGQSHSAVDMAAARHTCRRTCE